MARIGSKIKNRAGFSIMELLIFSAIFTAIMITFITVLVSVVKIGARQSAEGDVNQQSQFLLQRLQYYIERSSLVETPQDQATSTLKLRMAAGSEDPTIINLVGGIAYVDQGSGPVALTSSRVTVSNLTFTKRSNPPGKDSVQIFFTVEYNATNIGHKFVRSLDTAIARVSAANFDSNVIPSSTDAYSLGTGASRWDYINETIYFSNANPPNVGIGVSGPTAKLQVSGGNIYIDTGNNGLVIKDPVQSYCWTYKPTTVTGAWNISSSTCP